MKNKKMKKFLSAGLAASVMTSMLAGGAVSVFAEESKEVPTLTWWTATAGTIPEDFEDTIAKISDYTEEKIGVRFEIKTSSDYQTKINTVVNTGEYYDLMQMDGNFYTNFVNMGAFADLTELVQKETPDLYNAIPESVWKGVVQNGSIYAMPVYKDSAKTNYLCVDHALTEKYDIDVNALKTAADIDAAARKIKEGEAEDFYPIRLGWWNEAFEEYDDLSSNLPIGVKLDDESRQVVCTLEQEDIVESMNLVHSWYLDGIVNPDANINGTGPYRPIFIGQGWPSAAIPWAKGSGIEKYDIVKWDEPVYTTKTIRGSMISISANSKYQVEALKLLELVNTDTKLRDMLAYGIEGKDFEYNADGYVKRLTSGWPLMLHTQGNFFVMTPEEGQETMLDEIKALNEEARSSVCLGYALDITNIQNEVANCTAVWKKYNKDLQVGVLDPTEGIPMIIEEMKAVGLDTIISEAQKQIDEYFK